MDNKLGRSPAKTKNRAKGEQGEKVAAKFLKKNGYKVLCQNYSTNLGEIDIVASHNGYIVFVEVKARSSIVFGMPSEAVNQAKQRKIRNVALQFLKQNNLNSELFRFDVVEILDGKCKIIVNAF